MDNDNNKHSVPSPVTGESINPVHKIKSESHSIEYKVAKALSILFIVFSIGMISYKLIEGWSWINCFYFTGTTVLTIGSNIYPSTNLGKVFTVVFSIIGIALMFYVFATIVEAYMEKKLQLFVELPRDKVREHVEKILPSQDTNSEDPNTKV